MKMRKLNALLGISILGLLLLGTPVLAQNPTGTLTGTVTDTDGGSLPGVTITAKSPQLQGERVTQTGANGGYKMPFLPAGEYTVTFQLSGFQTAVQTVRISAAQTDTSNQVLGLSELQEEIIVTSNIEQISEDITGSSTYSQSEIEDLPIARNINQTVALAPGVTATGPSDNLVISGAMSFESLYLVNGVVINENLRGQPLDLFIEDAVQETTTQVNAISAEYGRFTGGVVNVLTKSGGNNISGSFRTNFTNDDWTEPTALTNEEGIEDKVNETFEATLGGPLLRDRAWLFFAGRDREREGSDQTALTNIVYPNGSSQERYEGKLTLSVTDSHSLIGSYLEIDQVNQNSTGPGGRPLDLLALSNRTDPQEIKSANYTGILTQNFFAEAQYSERDFSIASGAGGPQDLEEGTALISLGRSARWLSPFGCGECEDELRNNENALVKGSYFLSTEGLGTHDLSFGYDTFNDIRFSINHQSGSDLNVYPDEFFIDPASNEIFPIFRGDAGSNWVVAWPVFGADQVFATEFKTNSFYVNDSWQLSENISLNLGVRYDENDGRDSGARLVADDNKISPRVGLSWDIKGDGDLVMNASFGRYVAAVANSRADSTSTGGALGRAINFYTGPPINGDGEACLATGTCVSSVDARRQLLDWYLANGGINPLTDAPESIAGIPDVQFLIVPGTESNVIIPDSISSPSADEFTVGLAKRLGSKGLVRADLVYKEWDDFYSNRTDLGTGQVLIGGNPQDLTFVGNFGNDVLERDYLALQTQFRYRTTDRFTLAGTYTYSELEGNINGETAGSGPVATSPNVYPEYSERRWNSPVGPLLADQTHKLRLWGVYQLLDTDNHSLNVSLLQGFSSGTPYSASGSVETTGFVSNPGYISPPENVTYFFSDRGAFETDDITTTDIALNYAFKFNLFGKAIEIFIQPEVLNVFDEDGVLSPDSVIEDATTDAGTYAGFNPFTTTPVQGVNWDFAEDFGEATDEDDFQTPRTFRFSVGFRF